jgi:excisionase family DNA binding protein
VTTVESDWVAAAVGHLPSLVTVAEVVAVLRLSRRHLYRLVAAGKLMAVRHTEGGSSPLLIPRASIERYLRGLDKRAA